MWFPLLITLSPFLFTAGSFYSFLVLRLSVIFSKKPSTTSLLGQISPVPDFYSTKYLSFLALVTVTHFCLSPCLDCSPVCGIDHHYSTIATGMMLST